MQGSKDTLHWVAHGTELLRPYVARLWSAMHDPFAAYISLPSCPRAGRPVCADVKGELLACASLGILSVRGHYTSAHQCSISPWHTAMFHPMPL